MTDKNNTKTVWYDVKEKEMYIGYSSYNLNYVREWLKENFEIVEPEIDTLLKRQKAEIEALKELDKRLLKTARLERAEAYKEFAQKAAIELTNAYSSEYARWIDDTLNNLLEELVGDDK